MQPPAPHAPEDAVVRHAVMRGYLSEADVERARREAQSRGSSASVLSLLSSRLRPEQRRELEGVYHQAVAALGSGIPPTHVGNPPRGRASASPQTGRPARIGGYVVQGELARGGMGVVYRARHPELKRDLAVKVLLAGGHAGARQRERFRLEAEATARLRHPNIVAVHDVGEDEGQPFLAMDLIEGESLEQRLQREGPFEPRQAAEIARKVAQALHYAHEHMILHRDVKPHNVLLDRGGEPLLTDFGLAKFLDSERGGPTREGQLLGTPHYMAPEQTGKGVVDWRADVYSLGATLYALLVGEPPFAADSALELITQVLDAEPPPPSQRNPAVDRDLETICLTCLEKEPERRYDSARALAEDLTRYLGDQPILARPPTRLGRLQKWVRRNRTLAAVGAGALALLLVMGTLSAVWVLRARAATRAELAREAQELAQQTWSSWESYEGQEADEQTGLALAALQAAQRWHAQAPRDRAAAGAQFRAALALGNVALESEQWSLASGAYALALDLGVDDAEARELAAGVAEAREAETRRKADEVAGWLDQAESGALSQRPDGAYDAVFGIVRYPEPETVALLCSRLDRISAELRAAEGELLLEVREPTPSEARAGERAIEGLQSAVELLLQGAELSGEAGGTLREAGTRLQRRAHRAVRSRGGGPRAQSIPELIAQHQLKRVGAGKLLTARICCDAVGRIGHERSASVPALARYLAAEHDPLRAVPAGLALVRLGGPEALAELHAARRRYGLESPFAIQVKRALAGSEPTALEEESAAGYRKRGEERRAQGNLTGAAEDFTRALELEPDFADTWNDRGLVRMDQKDFARAEEDFTQALKLDPTNTTALGNRGNVRLLLGDAEGALADFSEALRIDPQDARALAGRGGLLSDRGEHQAALADLERALEIRPTLTAAWNNLGLIRRELGDEEGALADYTRALEIDPNLIETLNNRGLLRQAMGDLSGALEDLGRAVELEPRDAGLWCNLGLARYAQGDFQGAAEDHSRAIELTPRSARGWTGRAVARSSLRDLSGALEDYTRAIELEPKDPLAWSNRGTVRGALGDPQGAIADYTQALKLDPDYAGAWNNRGDLREDLGDFKRAISDFTRAIELDPMHPMPYVNRGQARQALGDLTGALSDFDRALELDPNDPRAWNCRGLACWNTDPARAQADFERALQADPNHCQALVNLGQLRQRAGDFAGTVDYCTQALKIDPNLLEAWAVRGYARANTSDLQGALSDMERFLELAPNHPRAKGVQEDCRRLRAQLEQKEE